ncbi:MAG: EF-hand domain-containing protein [Algibacter sp.]
MKTTPLKLTMLTLALFAYSFSITAQEKKKPDFDKMFKRFDANKDASISLEEFVSAKRKKEVPAEKLEKNYARLDADSNGSVTLEELKANFKKGKGKKKQE